MTFDWAGKQHSEARGVSKALEWACSSLEYLRGCLHYTRDLAHDNVMLSFATGKSWILDICIVIFITFALYWAIVMIPPTFVDLCVYFWVGQILEVIFGDTKHVTPRPMPRIHVEQPQSTHSTLLIPLDIHQAPYTLSGQQYRVQMSPQLQPYQPQTSSHVCKQLEQGQEELIWR